MVLAYPCTHALHVLLYAWDCIDRRVMPCCAQAKKHSKAHVTATAGPKNQTFLKDLGSDATIDYTKVCTRDQRRPAHSTDAGCTMDRTGPHCLMPRSPLAKSWHASTAAPSIGVQDDWVAQYVDNPFDAVVVGPIAPHRVLQQLLRAACYDTMRRCRIRSAE